MQNITIKKFNTPTEKRKTYSQTLTQWQTILLQFNTKLQMDGNTLWKNKFLQEGKLVLTCGRSSLAQKIPANNSVRWCFKNTGRHVKFVSNGPDGCAVCSQNEAEWWCWPCICVTAGDERRGTESGWGKAPYHWSQEMSSLSKCKTTILHGPQWLKYIRHHPSVKNNPWCTSQKNNKTKHIRTTTKCSL